MNIAYLKTYRHNLLGDFEINFLDANGNPYETVILAGENGCGKSTLLNVLFECTGPLRTLDPNNTSNEVRLFGLALNDDEAQLITNHRSMSNYFSNGFEKNTIHVVQNFSLTGWAHVTCKIKTQKGRDQEIPSHELNNAIGGHMRSLFSDVAINFRSENITQITTQEIDNGVENQKKSDERLATDITQLLIDIPALDALDLQSWIQDNPGQIPPRVLTNLRIERFSNAFSLMFPARKLSKIVNRGSKKEVEFIDGDKHIPLSDFSSGEKQIVFRGSFLLRDKFHKEGAVVFIDEPEISLHPRWQLKILNFYKTLVTNKDGVQTSQIFVATHSPFIIHNESRFDDKVYVLEKDSAGKITSKTSNMEFFNWTRESIVREAFKIDYSMHQVVRKTVFVEGELDEKYFNRTVTVFNLGKLPFDIKWVGRTTGSGTNQLSGKTGLDSLKSVFEVHPQLLHARTILFYDNDARKSEETRGNLLIRSAPQKFENRIFKKGTESLLALPTDFKRDNFLSDNVKDDGKGGETVTRKFDKSGLCNWLLDQANAVEVLAPLKTIILKWSQELC